MKVNTGINIGYYKSEIGWLKIIERNGAIIGINFCNPDDEVIEDAECDELNKCKIELDEYFKGIRKDFTVNIEFLEGTDFQKSVWNMLKEIKYGETVSYKDIAEKIGNPKAMRAVGGANNKNPIAIIVPCHRVIGKNGSLVGYAGGLNIKEYLLTLEKENKLRLCLSKS